VAPARSKGPDGGGGDAAAGTPGKVSHSPGQLPADTGAPVPREGLDDAALDLAIRKLAEDMRAAITAYMMAVPSCAEGCRCPLSGAIAAAVDFIASVEDYDAGKLVVGGLPCVG
jgi:hypothetical protein